MDGETEPKGKRGIKREDPEPRPVEGLANRGFVAGKDPSKHYVWVSEVNDPTVNVGYYLGLGYKICRFDPDEAKPTLGYQEYKQGDAIRSMGMTLMEVSAERKAEIERVGDGMNALGTQWADKVQAGIRKREIDLDDGRPIRDPSIKSRHTEQDDRHRWY